MEWIKIDKENLYEDGEVLAANFTKKTYGYGEKIIGYLHVGDDTGEVCCENEYELLNGATHYININEHDVV